MAVARFLERVTMAILSLSLVWADGGDAGKLIEWATQVVHITVEIVRKPWGMKTFHVLPRMGGRAHVRLDRQVPPPRP